MSKLAAFSGYIVYHDEILACVSGGVVSFPNHRQLPSGHYDLDMQPIQLSEFRYLEHRALPSVPVPRKDIDA